MGRYSLITFLLVTTRTLALLDLPNSWSSNSWGLNPNIARPEIQANQFELKPVMFQMLQTVGQFSGSPTDDPIYT